MARLKYDRLAELGLLPQLEQDLPTLFNWLLENEITAGGRVFDLSVEDYMPDAEVLDTRVALAQATGRSISRPQRQDEIKRLKDRFKHTKLSVSEEALWNAVQDPKASVRALHWEKLPAEAMAFYRPFHFPPFDQWGIYLLIGPMLAYHGELIRRNQQLKIFSPETLMHLILFEVFNHEFFHHLVESTATTLEVVLATQGEPQSIYLRHRRQQFKNEFGHPHAPLEEALANAYAYNALSFVSRIKAGFKTATVKSYQQAIANHWQYEPAGYCDADLYKGENYVAGGAVLLAHLLNQPNAANVVPLTMLAAHVMPSGFTALQAKPNIPTWLVGSEEELALFNQLVPAPNEAYTQLFWPYNTDRFDAYIGKKRAEQKLKKAA